MKIKRYTEFVNESTRSEVIAPDNKSAKELISKYAPWYMDMINREDKRIYRGLMRNDSYLLVDPSKTERKSRGDVDADWQTPLYYSNIMEESESWKKYSDIPRSRSIFCANDMLSTHLYGEAMGGETYVVIPIKENTEFIMAPTSDIYSSFYSFKYNFSMSMSDFLSEIRDTFDIKFSYNSLAELRNALDSASKSNLDSFVDNINDIGGGGVLTKEEIVKHGSFTNWFETLFRPDENGFKRVKYNENIDFKIHVEPIDSTYLNHELWTTGKCLLVREDLMP